MPRGINGSSEIQARVAPVELDRRRQLRSRVVVEEHRGVAVDDDDQGIVGQLGEHIGKGGGPVAAHDRCAGRPCHRDGRGETALSVRRRWEAGSQPGPRRFVVEIDRRRFDADAGDDLGRATRHRR